MSKLFSGSGILSMLGILTLLVIGTLGFLAILDVWSPADWFAEDVEDHTGQIAVPYTAFPIPAYTKITRDHLVNPRTMQPSVIWINEELAKRDGIMTHMGEVRGRVLKYNKGAGYVFTEDDFFPKGTREGLVAAVPAGKRAMRVSAEDIVGLYGLHPGDRFDLIATMAVETTPEDLDRLNIGGVYGQRLALEAKLTNALKRATVHYVVRGGVVVQPVMSREVAYTVTTFTRGEMTRTKPVQEAVIAVEPEEALALTEALTIGATISAVPRSGQPNAEKIELNLEDPVQIGNPLSTGRFGPDLIPEMSTVEMIDGDKRSLNAVVGKQ